MARAHTVLLTLILITGIAIVALLATDARGGGLDPGSPPASTMRPLDELMPAWDRALTAIGPDLCNTQRFKCVLPDGPSGLAVLDRETGLVWERTPATANDTWTNGNQGCVNKTLDARRGWRLPARDELQTLLFSDGPGPFDLGNGGLFFFTNQVSDDVGQEIYFGDGTVTGDTTARAWCVRGGTARPE